MPASINASIAPINGVATQKLSPPDACGTRGLAHTTNWLARTIRHQPHDARFRDRALAPVSDDDEDAPAITDDMMMMRMHQLSLMTRASRVCRTASTHLRRQGLSDVSLLKHHLSLQPFQQPTPAMPHVSIRHCTCHYGKEEGCDPSLRNAACILAAEAGKWRSSIMAEAAPRGVSAGIACAGNN
eukprot:3505319-Rhodomonas_salina.1